MVTCPHDTLSGPPQAHQDDAGLAGHEHELPVYGGQETTAPLRGVVDEVPTVRSNDGDFGGEPRLLK
jgi:hypothetical protein